MHPVFLGGGTLDPDAARWVSAVGAANVSPTRRTLVSNTIRDLKAAGVWAALDFLPVLAAENTASALVDWKARKVMTAMNSPTFTADRGYAFDGSTNYLATGFTPSTHCVAATGTSLMLGVYERTNVSSSGNPLGATTSTTQQARIVPRNASNLFSGALNATSVSAATSVTDSRGLSVVTSDGASAIGYKNGAQQLTAALTTPGSALTSVALMIGCYNTNGTPTLHRASTIGYALFGANAWTATQQLAFHTIMQRYLDAIFDPDAERWIGTVGEANVSSTRGALVSDTIRELKSNNVWAGLDFLPVLTAENAASALVDWKARKTMTAVNSPTFTTDRGYAFDGTTQYLATAFTPSTDCVAATGTSLMIGAYERTNTSSSGRTIGSFGSSSRSAAIVPRNSSGVAFAQLNTTGTNIFTSLTDSRGLTTAVYDGTNMTGYKAGEAGTPSAVAALASSLSEYPFFIGASNGQGTATNFRASTLGYAMFGANAWTAAQHLTFYNIMQKYMTTLGANV